MARKRKHNRLDRTAGETHPTASRRDHRALVTACVLLAALVWVVYGRALSSPFVFDDYDSVVQNPSIVRLFPLSGQDARPGPLTPPASSPVAGRPLVNLSFAVNYALGGLSPAGYHAFNVLIHLAAAILLFLIARRVLTLPAFGDRFAGVNGALALGASLLWALHPLQTDAVEYISQRTELLVGLCYLATIYCCLRYWSSEASAARRRWAIVAALACLLGMASKEVMVTAPIVALLIDRTLRSGSFAKAVRESWPLYAALAAGWLLLLYLNLGNPRGASAGFAKGVPARVWWFTQAKAIFIYLRLAAWPHPLSIHYAARYLRTVAAAWSWVVAALLLVAATADLCWRKHPAGLAGAWMLLILSPTLVVPINTEVIAERRMYLPLAGLTLFVVAGAYALIVDSSAADPANRRTRVAARRRPSAAFAGALALALLVASVGSARRLDAYDSDVTLWTSAVAAQPDDAFALYNLGVAHLRQGKTTPAIESLQASIAQDPAYAPAQIDLAVALGESGRPADAVPHLDAAVQLTPNDPDAQTDYGMVLSQLGRYAEAVGRFERAHLLAPRDLNVLVRLIDAQSAAGNRAEAKESAQQTIWLARSLGENGVADRVQAWLQAQRGRNPGAAKHPKG